MGRRRSLEDIEAVLRQPDRDWSTFIKTLKALPEEVDPELAASAALHLARDPRASLWSFARNCQQLPVPVIRVILEKLSGDRRPRLFFLREAVDAEAPDEDLRAAWKAALQGSLDLDTTYGWGSKQRKAKLQGVAGDPVLLQAIQTTVVACEQVPLDMLAVLTADASEASLDALIPFVERAVRTEGWELDRLEDLRTHARSTPAMDDLFTRTAALLQSRRARSPALDLARELGFGDLEVFWFSASLAEGQRHADQSVHYFHHCHIMVDSRAPIWFRFSASTSEDGVQGVRRTHFDSGGLRKDDLGMGACPPARFPAWIALAAERIGTQWPMHELSVRTGLRGKKREQLEQWLRGGA
ncbi:hypothetical protein LZ198_16925 [Myxococcus sp. K15C18031901]|uniref:hypothetical protein n=1 Tax=Myxococcus dinghuensis TaxID=2906761 RepID=UPI0020A80238|nr:hypothetical protein [Myxococcus dinghuensis]MCP3100555.1 hypothetical protein [Myxococcus dinghuensis]